MTYEVIYTGTIPNDGTGDPLRTAFTKINTNFDNVYTNPLVSGNVSVGNSSVNSYVNSTTLFLGNNSVNNISNSVSTTVSDYQGFTFSNSTTLLVSANIHSVLAVGNSSLNTSVTPVSVIVGNNVVNSSLTQISITTTNTTGTVAINPQSVTVYANAASFVSIGNSSVNTYINSNSIVVKNITSNGNAVFTGTVNVSTFYAVSNVFTIGTTFYSVSNGNIGIGNSVPTEDLRVEGTFSALSSIAISNASATQFSVNSTSLSHSGNGYFNYLTVTNSEILGSLYSGSNTATVNAVIGTSNTGYGIVGVSLSNSGVYGYSITNCGVEGESGNNYGVCGNSNTSWGGYFTSTSGNSLYAGNNTTEFFRVNSNGNIGIGNSAPADKLSINGNTYVRGQVAVGTIYDSTNSVIGYTNSAIATQGVANSGIGVQGVSNSSSGGLFVSTYGNGAVGTSLYANGVYGQSNQGSGGYFVSLTGYPLIAGNGSVTFLGVYANGNVGVGTVAPMYKLSVGGNAFVNTDLIVNNNVTVTNTVFISTNTSTTNSLVAYTGSGYGVVGVSNTGYAIYGTSNSGYAIYGVSNTSYAVYGNSVSSWGGYFTSNSGSPLYAGNTSTEYFRVNANGNVGIANNAPGNKLSVNGTTYLGGSVTIPATLASGNTTVTGFVNATSSVNAASYTIGSIFVANTIGVFANGTVNATSHTVGTYGSTTGGAVVNASTIAVGNASVYTVVNTSSLAIAGNPIANSTGANNAFNLGGTAASAYQLNSTLNANIASYLPNYSGVVNASSFTTTGLANVGSISVANVALVSGNLTVSGFASIGGVATVNTTNITTSLKYIVLANTSASAAALDGSGIVFASYANLIYSSSASGLQSNVNIVPAANNLLFGNTTSLWNVYGNNVFTNIVNAASHTVGSSFVANSSVLQHTGAANLAQVTVVGNTTHSGNTYFNANVYITSSAGIVANGTIGSSGQILTSNGSATYWGAPPATTGGTNTTIQFNDSNTLNGSLALTFDKTSNNLSVANTVSATDFNNVSDISLKKNILTITNSSDIVLNLNPVSFKWKDNDEKAYGLIAQEVEDIIPEIVSVREDGTKTVSYVQVIPLLVSMIKDQQKQINDINTKLQKLGV